MMQQKARMAGQNLGASLGVPHPVTGVAQGHHGVMDARLGQQPHLTPALMQAPIAYASQHGAFSQE